MSVLCWYDLGQGFYYMQWAAPPYIENLPVYISAGPLVGPPGCEDLVANFLAFLVFTYPLVHDISM